MGGFIVDSGTRSACSITSYIVVLILTCILTCPSNTLKSKQISNRTMRITFSLTRFAPYSVSGNARNSRSCVVALLLK